MNSYVLKGRLMCGIVLNTEQKIISFNTSKAVAK